MDQEAGVAPHHCAAPRNSVFGYLTGHARMRNHPGWLVISILSLLACLIESPHPSMAQIAATAHPKLIAGGSLLYNISNASIQAFDGSVECGVFQDGKGQAPAFHLRIQFPLGSSRWDITPTLEYRLLSNQFDIAVDTNDSSPKVFTKSGTLVPAGRARTYQASLSTLDAGLDFSYKLLPALRLSVGPRIGIWVKHSYLETEHITFPDSAYYPENGLSTRTIRSGSISTSSVLAAISLGASYDFQIPGALTVRPEINAEYTLTSVLPSWRIFSVAGGLSFVIPLGSDEHQTQEPVREKPAITPPVAETQTPGEAVPKTEPRSRLELSIKAFGVAEDNKEIPEPTLSVEQVHVQEVFPTLSDVFFEDGSSSISPRYVQLTSETAPGFRQADLYAADALDIQHHVMNIIGERLSDHPDWTITLIGTKSEHSSGDNRGNVDIAMARAQTVAGYLNSVWNIPYTRMKLHAKSLHDAPSDDMNPSGQAENRRVEIIPTKGDVTAPLWAERIEKIATPPQIHFDPVISTSAGVRSALIVVRQGSRVLQTIDALTEGTSGQYLWTLDQKSMPDDRAEANGLDSLTYTFEVEDTLGARATAEGVIHLHEIRNESVQHATDTNTAGREIERFSLLLFNYSSAQLEHKETERILGDVAKSLSTGGRVTMTGHTDKTGDDEFNERLAKERVTGASQILTNLLKAQRKGIPPMTIESHGSRDILFDNSVPEGRMLSRTVRILVEHDKAPRKVQE